MSKSKAEGEMLAAENKKMAEFKAKREAEAAKRGNSKQVIVMRTDLRNKNGEKIRTGKLCAQASHASMKVLLDLMAVEHTTAGIQIALDLPHDSALSDWLSGKFTKICVKGDSEAHIKELYEKAKTAGVPCSLILDAGLTEFQEPTYTCIAVGPGWSEDVDKITGGLSLL